MGCLGAIFGLLGLVFFAGGISSILNPSPFGGPSVVGILLRCALLPFVCWVLPACGLWWSRRRWTARFDAEGVSRRDGRRFVWGDFEGVTEVRRKHQRGTINHYEVRFRGGELAYVFPAVTANHAEVMPVLHSLLRGENPFATAQTPG
jgi:hypothetical protein